MGGGGGVGVCRLGQQTVLSDTKAKSETILPPHESLGMRLSLLN